jgi:hypothetical protein
LKIEKYPKVEDILMKICRSHSVPACRFGLAFTAYLMHEQFMDKSLKVNKMSATII